MGAAAVPIGMAAASAASSASQGKKGGGGPSVEDFYKAAKMQADASQHAVDMQTASNRPDQFSPFASTTWNKDHDGNWTQSTQLSGGLGAGANGLMDQIGSQGPLDNGTAARDQAIGAAYNQAASRLDPQWSQQKQTLDTQLANQGLTPGSEAYGAAQQDYSRARNDAYSSAMNNAIGQGTAAQQATFTQNLAAQMAPYQQLGMLRGLIQPLGFQNAMMAETPQYLQAALGQYQGNIDKSNASQAGKNNALMGAASLAGSIFGKR